MTTRETKPRRGSPALFPDINSESAAPKARKHSGEAQFIDLVRLSTDSFLASSTLVGAKGRKKTFTGVFEINFERK